MTKPPDDLPGDLPEIPDGSREATALDKSRHCPKCGREGRVSSNYLGVMVHCAHCKDSWAVSGPRGAYAVTGLPGRGIQKVTLVPPDITLAFEEEEQHEVKKRRK